ncbi:hypothetical protein BN975_05358 [Mycolicibacterium farcinogenes]|nr:hypothetical protein BN975_05358 [Mycolicibacterium farcinogenes]
MQLAGVADDRVADEHLGAATRMPRQFLGRTQGELHPGGAADHAYRLERIGRLDRTSRTPRSGGLAQPGKHRGDVLRLTRQRGVQSDDLVVGGSAVVRDSLDGPGLGGGVHHLLDREQCDVSSATGYVAAQGFQQPRQQRGGQLWPVGLQRVEHLGGVAARILGSQAPGVEHARGQERSGQDLDEPGQCQ